MILLQQNLFFSLKEMTNGVDADSLEEENTSKKGMKVYQRKVLRDVVRVSGELVH